MSNTEPQPIDEGKDAPKSPPLERMSRATEQDIKEVQREVQIEARPTETKERHDTTICCVNCSQIRKSLFTEPYEPHRTRGDKIICCFNLSLTYRGFFSLFTEPYVPKYNPPPEEPKETAPVNTEDGDGEKQVVSFYDQALKEFKNLEPMAKNVESEVEKPKRPSLLRRKSTKLLRMSLPGSRRSSKRDSLKSEASVRQTRKATSVFDEPDEEYVDAPGFVETVVKYSTSFWEYVMTELLGRVEEEERQGREEVRRQSSKGTVGSVTFAVPPKARTNSDVSAKSVANIDL